MATPTYMSGHAHLYVIRVNYCIARSFRHKTMSAIKDSDEVVRQVMSMDISIGA